MSHSLFYFLVETSQYITQYIMEFRNCYVATWNVLYNYLDIDCIHSDIHCQSCAKDAYLHIISIHNM